MRTPYAWKHIWGITVCFIMEIVTLILNSDMFFIQFRVTTMLRHDVEKITIDKSWRISIRFLEIVSL